MKKELLLVGGGGHCKAVIDVIEASGEYTIAGIIDHPEKIGETVLGHSIIGSDHDLEILFTRYTYALVTIGQIHTSEVRKTLYARLKNLGYSLPVIISPNAYVSPYAQVGEGSIIMHHSIINAAAIIGHNCIINTRSLIEHDARIEEHCHISTGAIVNGGTHVREGSFIGSNAVCKEYVETKPNDFIKAQSLFKGYS